MSRPLISVVIPTCGRQELLESAIASALSGCGHELEVVVVPNGGDTLWRDVQQKFADEDRVRFYPIENANGNAARNCGLRISQGEYVRFLDDDDLLCAEGATKQYASIETGNWDVCTGGVCFMDADGQIFSQYVPGGGADLVSEIFRQKHSTLNVGHLFKRSFLGDAQWDEHQLYLQDVGWMHSLLQRSEIHWRKIDAVVGAWRHHSGPRVSRLYPRNRPAAARRMAADIISKTITVLSERDRMTSDRRLAAAKALWDYAADGFIFNPLFWASVAMRARRLDSKSRPDQFFYHRGFWRYFNPVALEWLFLLPRVLWKRLKDFRRAIT